jgi:hypothetical protein
MSPYQQRITTLADTRIAAIADAVANLKTQLSELNRLRYRIRKAELSAGKSRPFDRRKRTRIRRLELRRRLRRR